MAPEDVRSYIAARIRDLLENGRFLDALPGYLHPDEASQGRLRILLNRLKKIGSLI